MENREEVKRNLSAKGWQGGATVTAKTPTVAVIATRGGSGDMNRPLEKVRVSSSFVIQREPERPKNLVLLRLEILRRASSG